LFIIYATLFRMLTLSLLIWHYR